MSSRRTTTLGALTAVAGLSVGLLTATAPASQAAIMGCPTLTVCLYTGNWFTGETQHISGYSKYANLNSAQHDNTTSWTNANKYARMGIGEWRNGKQHIAQKLDPGWYESDLRYGVSPSFNNMADFIVMA